MKVAVINFSGNVGKSTVAAHLLKPRLGDAPIFSIESINLDASADGVTVEKIRGKRFVDLQKQLIALDHAVIDVGASNVEEFLRLMEQYEGSHSDFDYFVVPAVKEKKQIADTINTIHALTRIGIQKPKIRVLLNKVDAEEDVRPDFASLFGLAVLNDSFIINPAAVIYSNDVFEEIKTIGKSLSDVTNDATDYRAKVRETNDPDEKDFFITMVGIKRLAITANRNLDAAYAALFQ